MLQKDPQPCQRRGQSDGEFSGEKHTIHHSVHGQLGMERNGRANSGKFVLIPEGQSVVV